MVKLRIGNDISVAWNVRIAGVGYFLEGKDLKLYITSPSRVRTEVTDFSVSGSLVGFTFHGEDQHEPGIYTLTLIENKGVSGMLTFDCCDALQLVEWSCLAGDNIPDELTLESDAVVSLVHPIVPTIGENGHWFVDGVDTGKPAYMEAGMSAYEIAVVHGFEGTESEWLESLKAGFGDISAEFEDSDEPAVTVQKSGTDMVANLLFRFSLPLSGKDICDIFDFFRFLSLDPPIELSSGGSLSGARIFYSDNAVICLDGFQAYGDGDEIVIQRQKGFRIISLDNIIRMIEFVDDGAAFPSSAITPDTGFFSASGVWHGYSSAVEFYNTSVESIAMKRIVISQERSATRSKSAFDFSRPASLNPSLPIPGTNTHVLISGKKFTSRGVSVTFEDAELVNTGVITVNSSGGITVLTNIGTAIRMILLKDVSTADVWMSDVTVNGVSNVFDKFWVFEPTSLTLTTAVIHMASDKILKFTSLIVVTESVAAIAPGPPVVVVPGDNVEVAAPSVQNPKI